MRTKLLTAAAALTVLGLAAPAAAQWAPQPNYGYGYGNGYGYQDNYGHVRALQARVDRAQRQIVRLDRRDILSNREARSLRNEAQNLEYRLRRAAANGLSYYESRELNIRLARLEQRVFREARDWNNRNDRNYWSDRDRDGRNDWREDDRGYDRD
ncbi:hypothetical protein G7076_07240 [Sphingomonas sp. HDW15A]|uniref:hypothetical protein n=1 Tax=Sphingomonas sp. HDW15A TaxID=2714942 RepID=UPI0014077B85|nr:hypothetical protein [Sphingomonas sp. HDW15A]QIK96267.1 hypothetical protein G7076_07240 [Sphingomonas sp. HDW15A]